MCKYFIIKALSFIFACIFLFPPLPATAETADEVLYEIQNQLCPCKRNFSCNKKMQMPKIIKESAHFQWQDRSKPMVFDKSVYNEIEKKIRERIKTIINKPGGLPWDLGAIEYAAGSVCLIPPQIFTEKYTPHSRTKSFADAYVIGAYRVAKAEENKRVTVAITAKVLKKLADCCNPPVKPDMIPDDLDKLNRLLNDTNGTISTRVPADVIDTSTLN
jgi:hypothetical protein